MSALIVDGAIQLQCDGCGVSAPDAPTLLAHRGLNNMGWRCAGGKHVCPACVARQDAPGLEQVDEGAGSETPSPSSAERVEP